MLEQQITTILRLLEQRTIGQHETIAVRDVLSANIPNGVKTYLRAEVSERLLNDLRTLSHFTRVDTNSLGVKHLSKTLLRTLSTEYVFQRDEFFAALPDAVQRTGNYVCRPQGTLAQFLFGEKDRIDYPTLISKLNHFSDYSYLRKLIDRYVTLMKWKEVSLNDFRSLIKKIDDQVVKRHSGRELALLARPIFEFFLLAESSGKNSIPIKPILQFYEDKKMYFPKEFIERICEIRKKKELSQGDLVDILEDLYQEDVRTDTSAPQPDVRPARETAQPVPIVSTPPWDANEQIPLGPSLSETVTPDRAILEHDVPGEKVSPLEVEPGPPEANPPAAPPPRLGQGPNDLAERILRMDRDEAASTLSGTPASKPSDTHELASTDSRQEKQAVEHELENTPPPASPSTTSRNFGTYTAPEAPPAAGRELPASSLPDLNAIITELQREKFIKKIFKKDDHYYDSIIAALNRTRSWKEAALNLNHLFETNGLDPFSEIVIEFTDAIYSRYVPGHKGEQ